MLFWDTLDCKIRTKIRSGFNAFVEFASLSTSPRTRASHFITHKKHANRARNAMQIKCAHSIADSPVLLFLHFFAVAFYAIWVMFTHPRKRVVTTRRRPRLGDLDAASSSSSSSSSMSAEDDFAVKPVVVMERPGLDEYPYLAFKSVRVVSGAPLCIRHEH